MGRRTRSSLTVLAQLDAGSRKMVQATTNHVAVIVLLIAIPYAAGTWTFPKSLETLGLCFWVNALWSMFSAVVRKEPCGAGALNRWDQALVFIALQQLVHAAQKTLVP